MSGHTATPWRADNLAKIRCSAEDGKGLVAVVHDGVYAMQGRENIEISRANAAFIVTACNSHADLTEALKGATVAANIAGSLLKEKDTKIETLSDSHADLVKALEADISDLEIYINNPSAWDSYDDDMSERLRKVVNRARAALATLTARKVG